MMILGEKLSSPKKKVKYNGLAVTGGGVVQNNCAFANIASSNLRSVGDALRAATASIEGMQVDKEGKMKVVQ